ncbi:SIR2 family protein [Lutibacter sp.]|uniref:SIR2 family protein n=1 Tax=Lutibacter sp. TaxID=1925666 RepID=UPI003561F33D
MINRIKEKKNEFETQIPKTAFFLGAGCSKSSKIPLGSEIIDILKKLWYLDNFEDKSKWVLNDFEIDDSFFNKNKDKFEQEISQKELELKETILQNKKDADEKTLENIFYDNLYGFWFSNFSEDPRERQRLIEFFIDKSSPSGAYILLAFLISNNIIKNVFTSNFDDLINQTLIQFTDTKARVYSHNEIARFINIYSTKPNIIKLHGDYLFENLKNTKQETESLDENMETKFREALISQDLVVIGYNGSDKSIMQILKKIKSDTKFGLYWCASNYENLNWQVKKLLNSTENSYFIEIEKFEYFIYKIYESFEDIKTPDFQELYNQKNILLSKYITEFSTQLQEINSINNSQKQIISNKLSIILNDNSFKEVYNLTFDKQLEFLKNLRLDGVSRILKNIHTTYVKSDARKLFDSLDIEQFFQNKMKEASLVHLSNALTNLKEIDKERTISLLNSLDSKLVISKIQNSQESEIYSSLGELGKISPNKILEIKKAIKPKDNLLESIKNSRELIYTLRNISKGEAINFIKLNRNEIIKKIENDNIKDISFFLTNLNQIDKLSSQLIFNNLNNDKLSELIIQENLNQIGIFSNLFSKINKTKTFEIFKSINKEILIKKVISENFSSLQLGIYNISLSNNYLAYNLIESISEKDLLLKAEKSSILKLADGLNSLSELNSKKIERLFSHISNDSLIEKINRSNFTYQQLGSTINKLSKIDYSKTKFIIKNSDFSKLSSTLVTSINKLGPQVFLHFLPIISKIDSRLIDIYTKPEHNEFLNELLSWKNFEKYTVNLKHLEESFKRNGMTKESKFVGDIIKNNDFRLTKKNKKKYLH